MRTTSRLGIMGGTFDPIHFGHLVTAEEALVQFNLDRVVFMPAGQPMSKGRDDVSSAEDRYAMTVLATASNPDFEVSRVELDRPGPTYTVDTLRTLHEIYGPQTALFFITGTDAVREILSWKSPEEVASLTRFIAATRPGYDLASMGDTQVAALFSDVVDVMEIPALSVSSTEIRARVRSGLPIRYLLPEPVADYARKVGLYAGGHA